MWLNSPTKQAFPFDVDGSMRCLTLCAGGLWYEIGQGTCRLQPLRFIENPTERAFWGSWVLRLLEGEGLAREPGVSSFIDVGLEKMKDEPRSQRTLTQFCGRPSGPAQSPGCDARKTDRRWELRQATMAERGHCTEG